MAMDWQSEATYGVEWRLLGRPVKGTSIGSFVVRFHLLKLTTERGYIAPTSIIEEGQIVGMTSIPASAVLHVLSTGIFESLEADVEKFLEGFVCSGGCLCHCARRQLRASEAC